MGVADWYSVGDVAQLCAAYVLGALVIYLVVEAGCSRVSVAWARYRSRR